MPAPFAATDHPLPGHVQLAPEHVRAAGPVHPIEPKTCRRRACFVNSHNAQTENLLKWAGSVGGPIWNDSLLTFLRLHPVQFWAWADFKGGSKLKREGVSLQVGTRKPKGVNPHAVPSLHSFTPPLRLVPTPRTPTSHLQFTFIIKHPLYMVATLKVYVIINVHNRTIRATFNARQTV